MSDDRHEWFRGSNGANGTNGTSKLPPPPASVVAPPPPPASVVSPPPVSVAPPPPASAAPPPAPSAPPSPPAPHTEEDVDAVLDDAPTSGGRRRAIVVGVLVVATIAIVVGVKSRHGARVAVAPATVLPAPPPLAPVAPVVAAPPAPEIALDPGAPARTHAPVNARAASPTKAADGPPSSEKPTDEKAATHHADGSEAPSDEAADSGEQPESRHHHHHHHEHREHHSHEHHERAEKAPRHEHADKATKAKGGGDRDAARTAYQRGNGLLLSGNAAGSVAAYEEAVRLAPSDPIGYRGLGLAYEKQGKTKEAIAALVSYLKLSKHARDREVIARRLYRLTHAEDGGLAH
ncbi:MAG TPA: tetratricopeptide repeat protein [Polyangia bacterium]|nr:tetratricopeptide repeat protein [Polyangia bacterium]